MADYKLTNDPNVVIRESDGSVIPKGNYAWDMYQAWLDAGGVPDPWETQEEARAVQIQAIQNSVESALHANFKSSAVGVEYTYINDEDGFEFLFMATHDAIARKAFSPAWEASTTYTVGDTVVSNGQVFVCTQAGASDVSAPEWPTAIATPAVDGSAAWQIWTIDFWVLDAAASRVWVSHTADQIIQVERDAKALTLAIRKKQSALNAQVMLTTDIPSAQAIVWSFP